jgi:MFS family permease
MALGSFKSEFGLTTKTSKQFADISANIVSTYQGGCFFGSLLGYPLGQIFGRKMGLLVSSLVFILGAGVVSLSFSLVATLPIFADARTLPGTDVLVDRTDACR